MRALSYINGEWIASTGNQKAVYSPYTNELIGELQEATTNEVESALQSAFEAKKEIAAISAYERAKILRNVASLLETEKDRFAYLISREIGKPINNTLDEVVRSVETLELSADEAKRLTGETIPGDVSPRGINTIAATFKVPVGVIAAITPFNAPLNLLCHKIGPAFAAGNSIILKPAPQATLVSIEFIQLLIKAGFPTKAINMVLGGSEVGMQIVGDERVNLISFTGSVKASNEICKASGTKKVLLELGGNAATIVHKDANLKRAANLCARTGYSNAGQTCISVQRIYVHNEVVNEFTQLIKKEVQKLTVGDPLDKHTDIGCLVDEQSARRIQLWIQEAIESGAQLLNGGIRNGAVVEPTILLNPPKNSKVVCEEVFGPIVSIIPYASIEEAINEANDSKYGLQLGLFTNSMDLAYKVAKSAEVGGVIINGTSNFRLDHYPYGGIKDSGVGKEGPRFAIQEMLESKMIVFQVQ